MELIFEREFDFFLTPAHGGASVNRVSHRGASIKDIIESFGVPHTEVGRMGVSTSEQNKGRAAIIEKDVDFHHVPRPGARIHVYPLIPPVDVTRPSLLRPRPLGALRFVADVNVGRLARLLLVLGFDTRYDNGFSDAQVACIAAREGRVVLTRDTGLLKRRQVTHALRIRSELPDAQLTEVLRFFGMEKGPFRLLSRCLACNESLVPVEKKAVVHRLKPLTRKYYHRFTICPGCGRIFWKGSHAWEMRQKLRALLPGSTV